MESPFNQIALRSPFFDTGVFTPLSLFSASEPGAWYDPSDMSTMFQDFNGATAVTAVEQPVSVLLDKSKNGVGTNGTRRLNLVTYSEQFNNAAWTATTGGSISATNSTTAPDGTVTADTWLQNAVPGTTFVRQITSGAAGTYTVSIYVKKITSSTWFRLSVSDGTNFFACSFDLDNGVAGVLGAGGSGWSANSASIVSAANGFYRLSVTGTTPASNPRFDFFLSGTDNSGTRLANGSCYVWGADLRLAADANVSPTYQRVTDTWYNVQAGSHAYTPSGATASRPVLSARYNLLTKTEQFDDAAWTKGNCTITQNAGVAPDGTTTADTLVENTANAAHVVFQAPSVLTSGTYRFATYIKANGRNFASIKVANTGTTNQWAAADFDLVNLASVTVAGAGGQFTGLSATILDVGNGWRFCTLTFTSSSSISNVGIQSTTSAAPSHGSFGDVSFVGSGADALLIWGADYRVSNDGVALPTYQRVNTSTDYNTTNFPMYLRFDGSDDYMLTGTITPGTDKAQVFAGVRKLSESVGIVTELSTTISTNAGSLYFVTGADPTASDRYSGSSRGSAISSASLAAYSRIGNAPDTAVITTTHDIAGDLSTIRNNTVAGTSSTADKGTGNFLAYPLYIGRRGGTTLPFNGRLFGLIVRFGANLDNTQITNTETWMNGKTKAY